MAQTVVVGFSWMVVKPRRGPRAKVYVVVAMLDANGRLAKPLITDANNKCPGIVLQVLLAQLAHCVLGGGAPQADSRGPSAQGSLGVVGLLEGETQGDLRCSGKTVEG